MLSPWTNDLDKQTAWYIVSLIRKGLAGIQEPVYSAKRHNEKCPRVKERKLESKAEAYTAKMKPDIRSIRRC
jgi:uncharacterized protein YfaA (DUF2138 family)